MATGKDYAQTSRHMRAALRLSNPIGGLEQALEFIRLRDDHAVKWQCDVADDAAKILRTHQRIRMAVHGKQESDFHLLFGNLHLEVSRLYRRAMVDKPRNADDHLHHAARNCGQAVTAGAARLLAEVAREMRVLGERDAAADAFRRVARPWDAGELVGVSKKLSRDSAERSGRVRLRLDGIEGLLAMAQEAEHAGLVDTAAALYTEAANAAAEPDSMGPSRRQSEADDTSTQPERWRLESDARHGIGNCRLATRSYPDALAAYLEAYRLRGRLNGQTMEHLGLEVRSLAAIAHVHALLGNSEADAAYRDALRAARAVAKKEEVSLPVAEAYEHLASARLARAKYRQALDHTKRAGEIYTALGDICGSIRIAILKGDILAASNEWDQAYEQYCTAYEACEKSDDQRTIGHIHNKLGHLALARNLVLAEKQYNGAIGDFDRAQRIGEKLTDIRLQLDANNGLLDVYKRKEHWQRACKCLEAIRTLERELVELEQHRAVKLLQGRFDPDQARRDRQQLRSTQQAVLDRDMKLLGLGAQIVQQGECIRTVKQNMEAERKQGTKTARAKAARAKTARTKTPKPREKTVDAMDLMVQTLRAIEHWSVFEQQSDRIHPGAMRSLRREYTLTPTQTNICALALQGKSHSQIAGYLITNEKNIDQHVNDIRKRLGLERGDDLVVFLQSLADPFDGLDTDGQRGTDDSDDDE